MKTNFNFGQKRPLLALSDVAPGLSAVVVSVEATGPIGRRLLDLGFLPETLVTVLRRAPLGDPSVFGIRGSQLCLRRSETARIRVRLTSPSSSEGAPVF